MVSSLVMRPVMMGDLTLVMDALRCVNLKRAGAVQVSRQSARRRVVMGYCSVKRPVMMVAPRRGTAVLIHVRLKRGGAVNQSERLARVNQALYVQTHVAMVSS